MTPPTTSKETPERIWILRTDAQMVGKYQTVGGLDQVWVGDDGVEYVRAEMLTEVEAENERLRARLLEVTNALGCYIDVSATYRRPYEHPLSAYDRARAELQKDRKNE